MKKPSIKKSPRKIDLRHESDYQLLSRIAKAVEALVQQGAGISQSLTQGGLEMAQTYQQFLDKLTANTSATQSMMTVLQSVVDKLKTCSTVQDFQAATDQLDANTKALTDAAMEGTKAASEPPAVAVAPAPPVAP